MADDNKINDGDKNIRKMGAGKMQPGTIMVWGAIIVIMVLLFSMKEKFSQTPPTPLTQYDFIQKVNSNLIASAQINYGSTASYLTEIRGSYFEVDSSGNKITGTEGKPKEIPFRVEATMARRGSSPTAVLPSR